MSVCADAPGKIILFGEHFVIGGVPAIATAIDLRAKACSKLIAETHKVLLESKYFESRVIELYPSSPPPHAKQFRIIIDIVRERFSALKPMLITLESKIPPAAGLGSSAATAVAFTACYLQALGIDADLELVSEIAFEAEKIVHGKPSGIDNTIAVYGGTILYSKTMGFKRLKPSLKGARIVIADSGIARSTGEAVRRVLARRERLGRLADELYRFASLLVEEAITALEKGDLVKLGELMDVNHGLLNALGVSLPELEVLVTRARRAGAYGAKITGAGLGGSIIALVDDESADKVVKALKPIARNVYSVEINVEGLRVKGD